MTTQAVRPVSWRRNLYVLCLAQFLVLTGFQVIFPFLPLYLRDLGIDNVDEAAIWAGILGAGTSFLAGIMSPIWGALADRHGRRVMVIRALFANAVLMALMGLSATVWQLLALRMGIGLLGGSVAAITALLSVSVPPENLGSSLGLAQSAYYVGSSTGPLLGGFLADRIGFRPVFAITALLLVFAGVLVVWFVREDFQRPTAGAGKARIDPLAGLRLLRQSGPLKTLALVLFLIQFTTFIILPVLPLYVANLGVTQDVASISGLIVALTSLVAAVCSSQIGRLADRLGYKRVLLACAVGAGLAYLPQAFVRDAWQLLAFRAVLGVFIGGLLPTTNALIARQTPRSRRGSAYGLTGSVQFLGSALGPLLGGFIAAGFGIPTVFLVITACMVVMVLVVSAGVSDAVVEDSPAPASAETPRPARAMNEH